MKCEWNSGSSRLAVQLSKRQGSDNDSLLDQQHIMMDTTTTNDFTKHQGSMDWTADDEEELQQSPPPTPQKRQHSDTETSSSKRQATESAPITYASVTKPTQATQDNQVSQLTPSQIDRHRRTLILRRLPYDTTTEDITNALRYELDTDKLNDYIDSILRDKDDRRRYYVTFNRYEDKRRIA